MAGSIYGVAQSRYELSRFSEGDITRRQALVEEAYALFHAVQDTEGILD